MNIQPLKNLVKEALKEVKKFQTGEKKIIKTLRPYIDNVGIGLINGSTILLAAGSGVGKSFELNKLLKNILNKEINPDADKYVSLLVSLEMRILSIVLRDLEGKLSKEKKDILLETFTEEEKQKVKDYYELLQDDRNFICQEPTGVEDFYNGCISFLEENKDKDSVIISVDHIVLISSDKGKGKNQVVENFIESVNKLKMKYKNVIFILVSQTNSDNQRRAAEKDRMSQPKDLDIYYSQFSFQVADYVCVIQNAWKLGIEAYSKINPKRYPNLEKYFLEEDSKGKVSLTTEGVLYYHLLKCREGGSHYTDIFAEEIYLPESIKEKTVENNKSSLSMPVFEKPSPVEPNFDMSLAFENDNNSEEEDDEVPF